MAVSNGTQPSDEVETLFEMVRRKYGDRLSDEELSAVRREDAVVEHTPALRSVKLANGDEPWSIFKAENETGGYTLVLAEEY